MCEDTGIKFSIIVVSLNPGARLAETVDSILLQSYKNYEVIIKDGGSSDSSIRSFMKRKAIASLDHFEVFQKPDGGIYDGMNQALEEVTGDYIIFLNCGDCFHDKHVLSAFAEKIGRAGEERKTAQIFYGIRYSQQSGCMEYPAPEINGFTCYRNIPCHQTCFYSADLFKDHKYRTKYVVRADYEHFLWCYYVQRAAFTYLPVCVVDYEGGGFSETPENIRRSAGERKEIIAQYMKRTERLRYGLYMMLSLAPLRRFLASNEHTTVLYHKLITKLYNRKSKGKS